MRISAHQDDPGYDLYARVHWAVKVVVRVNGDVIDQCVTADTKRGCALVYELGPTGRPVFNADGKSLKLKQLPGRVEIEFERRTQ